ncbi:MAG: hypothetical protein Kow0069_12690 [Promethearchaeota archaeon]
MKVPLQATVAGLAASATAALLAAAQQAQADPLAGVYDYLGWLITGLSFLLNYARLVLLPLGDFMRNVVDGVVAYLPDADEPYLIAFVVVVMAAFFVNANWPNRTGRTRD